MMDIELLRALWANAAAMRWVLLLILVLVFYRYMNAEENTMEWWHFISTRGPDGKHYADLDKFGKATGIVIGSVSIIQVSANAKGDFAGFALVLTAYFAFVGGVAGYAAYLRSKQGTVTTVTEPIPDSPPPMKTTVTEAPPVAEKKGKK